jgi:hypothetical protein
MNWWKKLLVVFSTFACWMVGLVTLGAWGYESHYFWASGCAVAIGFAVAPFWRLRTSIWYWPTVALFVFMNIIALIAMREYVVRAELPSKGIIQGLLVVDCMVCWLMMVGIAYSFERRFPWND